MTAQGMGPLGVARVQAKLLRRIADDLEQTSWTEEGKGRDATKKRAREATTLDESINASDAAEPYEHFAHGLQWAVSVLRDEAIAIMARAPQKVTARRTLPPT